MTRRASAATEFSPPVQLGLFWGVLLTVLGLTLPGGMGTGVFLLAVGAYAAWTVSRMIARGWPGRTALAAGGLVGAAGVGGFGWLLLQGREPGGVHYALYLGAVLLALGILSGHARLWPEPWRALSERVKQSSLLELLLGKHIRST